MKKLICIVVVLAMVLTLVLAGCGGSKETTPKEEPKKTDEAKKEEEPQKTAEQKFDPSQYPLAINMIVKGHPVHRIVQLGFLSKAKELGYPAEILGSEGADAADAVALAEQGIAKGVKGMLVWAHVPAFYPVIKKASDAGIKIVVPHFTIKEGDASGIDSNLAADPVKYSQDAAKAIGDKLAGKKGSVAVTQGSFNTVENSAAGAFTKYMNENYPDLKVLKPIEEGFDPPAAVSKAIAIIQANPDLLGAYSTTGGGPVTWAGAMDQTNRPDLVCIGMDYTEQNIDLVKNGKIYAIVAQPLYEEAQQSVVILDKLLRGEKVPYFTPLDAPIVTRDGIGKYDEIIKKVKEWFK